MFHSAQVKASWYHRSDIIDKIDRFSRVIARDYLMMIGQSYHKLHNSPVGYCNHDRRRIWVNPMGIYRVANAPVTAVEASQGSNDVDESKLPSGIRSTYDPIGLQTDSRRWLRNEFDTSRNDEWIFAQAVAFHERLHERFTNLTDEKRSEAEPALRGFTQWVWNALEDERIERLGSKKWSRVRRFINSAGRLSWRLGEEDFLSAMQAGDFTQATGVWILGVRHATRAGVVEDRQDALDLLHPDFRDVGDELVDIWLSAVNDCSTADQVWDAAMEVVDLIGPDPQELEALKDLLNLMEDIGLDSEGENPEASEAAPGGLGPEGQEGGEDEDGERPQAKKMSAEEAAEEEEGIEGPFDEGYDAEMDEGADPHSGKDFTYMGSPQDILTEPGIGEAVRRLRSCFEIPDPDTPAESRPSTVGKKLSARHYRRDPDKPFLRRSTDEFDPGRIYSQLLIDWSSSMSSNYDDKGEESAIEFSRKLAVVLLKALEGHPQVLHETYLMPNDVFAADNKEGETGLIKAAGIRAAQGTKYTPTFRASLQRMEKHPEDSPILFMTADGATNDSDARKCREIVETMRHDHGALVRGVGICNDRMPQLRTIFGEDNFLLVPNVAEMVDRIETVMATFGSRHFGSSR